MIDADEQRQDDRVSGRSLMQFERNIGQLDPARNRDQSTMIVNKLVRQRGTTLHFAIFAS
jgi:hypothetical protein